MTRKVYRTAQGKMVDLGALQLRNENVRAVGNMNVNARGDLVDSSNKPISSRNQQVAKQYRKQAGNVSDQPVVSSRSAASRKIDIPAPPEDFDDDFIKEESPQKEEPASGLAAAIARARQVKQEPLKTTSDVAKQTPGVRKI